MPRTSNSNTRSSHGARKQNPVVKLLKRNKRFRPNSKRNNNNSSNGGAVGTEAVALANIERNRKNFNYPPEGFVTKMEYSLVYNMINEPKIYPEETVINHILEEDFEAYLEVDVPSSSSSSNNGQTSSFRDHSSSSNDDDDDDSDSEKKEEPSEKPAKISYAQLSAILALSAENFPPPRSNSFKTPPQQPPQSIPQKLCKTVLQCVVRFAEDHNLDREEELRELLEPVERHYIKRNNKAAFRQILPFYVGYVATCVTANPLPMLVGALAMSAMGDKTHEEADNFHSFHSEKNRRTDIEKTGLLDETEHN